MGAQLNHEAFGWATVVVRRDVPRTRLLRICALLPLGPDAEDALPGEVQEDVVLFEAVLFDDALVRMPHHGKRTADPGRCCSARRLCWRRPAASWDNLSLRRRNGRLRGRRFVWTRLWL